MKRPNDTDEEVCGIAAEKLWEQVKAESSEGRFNDAESVKNIADAIQYEDDGYRIARELERNGWSPDEGVVEVMSCAFVEKQRALDALTKKWVDENGIAPALDIGAKVRIKQNAGEVIKIDRDAAKYWVFCAELGHVREGNGTLAVIVKYEDVEVV